MTDAQLLAAAKAMNERRITPISWDDLTISQKWRALELAYTALKAAEDARR